ncbi:efflux RND transporter permease subunit [Nonomuraea sp. KC401]|uniref:efflux RND transporter permease subunit n=1 Tax=unclassified Nonomuraea TaxID=2593643 RepID=UPI0010FCF5F1|nr:MULTISPECIES: efflux RND transporter permease subunit [unclassified Nonomuraea]NBF00396.1 MMPL family transporter [Nonomuraea sp. K271]TLF48134.1 efflux RND transporter permease subunit [Nonomuraea sp. KC401]
MTAFARLSLVNRSLVILIALVLTGFGVFAIPQLNQQLLPSLSFPGAFVVAPFPGASPEIVEDQVTKPIEDSFQGLAGMEQMTSSSKEGLAQIQVAFEYGTDVESSVNKMQQAINRVALPEGVEPQVVAGSTDDIPVLVLAVGDGGDERSMADKLRRILVPELQGVEGVREVSVTGAREEVVTIRPDAKKLALAGVSVAQIPEVLKANGTPIPAGTLTDDGKALTVQVGSRVDSLLDLENLYLTPAQPASAPQQARPQQGQPQPGQPQPGQTQSGQTQPGQAQAQPGQGAVAQQQARPKRLKPVKLGDVAEIKRGLAEATTLTRTDGTASLGVAVTMSPDGNAVTISHDIREKLPELTRALGDSSDTAVSVVFDQAPYVEESIESLTTEGVLGLVFAVLVILVFLLSVRSTLVTAVSIPLSVVIALLALWAGDYSLNMLTLGALTIAVGRVVDDSIVVLENIKRHLGYGEAKLQAILTAVREVSGAVTASTLTTVAVFAPIAIVGGMVGELFSPFAITVAVALLASLVVSLTVVPVLAYWFLRAPVLSPEQARRQREEAEAKELRSPLQRAYLPVLRFATRFKLVTVLIGVAVFVGTMGLAGGLQTNFLDASGQNTLSLSQRMPVGTDLESTDKAARKVEEVLAGLDGVETYQVNVGGGNAMSGGAVGGGADRASYSVTLKEGADTARVERVLREEIAGLSGVGEVTVGAQAAGFASDTIDVIVQAPDAEALREATESVTAAMGEVSGLEDVSSDLETSAPRVEVVVDREEAAERGLSEAQVGQAVAQAFRGAPLGQITLDGRASDLVLRGSDAPEDVEAIENLKVATAAGMVKVSSVAEVRQVAGPTQVSRIDGERSATVSAKAEAADLGSVTQALTSKLDGLSLAAGASYEIGGVSADQADAFADLGLAMLAAVAIVFLIMVATFRSFVQPVILLVSIPFAATGAIGLLVATDTALGVPALIGMLMLIGIVVTNAIVLIDLINQYRDQGMGVVEAVIEGGRRRLRPILMTAVATICALTPMALGVTGSGGFISQPLAIVVIGGLISSTLLTLVLVPTLYVVVTRKGEGEAGPASPRVREGAGGAGTQDLAGHPA